MRDHEIVIANLYLWSGEIETKRDKRRQYDREPTVCAIVNALPEPPWSMDVHLHLEILESALHDGLSKFFPAKSKEEEDRHLCCIHKVLAF